MECLHGSGGLLLGRRSFVQRLGPGLIFRSRPVVLENRRTSVREWREAVTVLPSPDPLPPFVEIWRASEKHRAFGTGCPCD